MSNGLLSGLTNAWNPDVSKAMIDLVAGVNTGSLSDLSYVTQSGFPGAKALQGSGADTLATGASSTIQAIGNTDFLIVSWCLTSALNTDQNLSAIGENANNGVDFSLSGTIAPWDVFAEIPDALGNYSCSVTSTGTPFSGDVPHMIAIWYTNSNSTLHLSVDNGTVFSAVNTGGIGTADATNFMTTSFHADVGTKQEGPFYLWQCTDGVANAISQLSNLYTNKLQYSDFDSGGGGGGGSAKPAPVETFNPFHGSAVNTSGGI